MKTLLIAAALNMQLTYDDMAVCKQAQAELTKNSIQSICIPKGKDTRTDDMFETFTQMIQQIQKLQQEGTVENK